MIKYIIKSKVSTDKILFNKGPRGKESTEVRKSQIKGKESENSYQELKRSPKDRHTHTHTETVSRYFDRHGRLSQSEESKCL